MENDNTIVLNYTNNKVTLQFKSEDDMKVATYVLQLFEQLGKRLYADLRSNYGSDEEFANNMTWKHVLEDKNKHAYVVLNLFMKVFINNPDMIVMLAPYTYDDQTLLNFINSMELYFNEQTNSIEIKDNNL